MTKIKKLPKSEVEIEHELASEVFEEYFPKALKGLSEKIEINGFRKGKVPENVLLAHVPEIQILEEMAELAIGEHYPKILETEKIDAIGRPEVTITKLVRKNPFGFKIKTAVVPEVKLPNYKKIGKGIISKITASEKNIVVTEADVENTITDIRKSRAEKTHLKESGGEDMETSATQNLPAFDNAFVRTLGPFVDIDNFKNKLRENLKLEKENQAKEKTRLKIIQKIVEESQADLPEILVEVELDKILYQMESDVTQMGLKFKDYLKYLNKKTEDLRKEFRSDAEQKAKFALVMNEIAKLEQITAQPSELQKEVEGLLATYKDADPERARAHVENVLVNEKIFQFLENL